MDPLACRIHQNVDYPTYRSGAQKFVEIVGGQIRPQVLIAQNHSLRFSIVRAQLSYTPIPAKHYRTAIDLTFLVFVFFFAQEVVGVERSLKANNGLVGENIWSFGQVIAPCFI